MAEAGWPSPGSLPSRGRPVQCGSEQDTGNGRTHQSVHGTLDALHGALRITLHGVMTPRGCEAHPGQVSRPLSHSNSEAVLELSLGSCGSTSQGFTRTPSLLHLYLFMRSWQLSWGLPFLGPAAHSML